MMRMPKNKAQGSSIIEVLIAMAVLTLGISAVMLLVFGNQTLRTDAQTNNEALTKAESMLEDARALARQDFSAVVSIPETTDGIYHKSLDAEEADAFTKNLTSTVVWQADGGRTQRIQLKTTVTDWTTALGGDTCSPTLSGDWTHPQLLGTADVGQNNGGTDVDVLSKKAYVTADASDANKGDFYIVDVSDPNLSNLPVFNPGGLNTGPGLSAVHVAGRYAYVANMSTTAQLQVIDISTPSSPFVAASLKVTAPGETAVGESIFYANKKVYLGLDRPAASGREFYVIDVSSPLSLSASSIKASFEVNSKVSAITVKNGIAYLAVPDDPSTSGVSEQLKVLDVSRADSGIISPLSPFGPNPSTMSGEGLYVSKDGKTLYLGQGGANPGNNPEFFSLNIANPGSISQINSKYIPTSSNVTVNAIAVRSNLVFLWTSDTNLGFQIWDLNNLSSPAPYGALNTQQTPTGGFDCEGNIVYTAQRSNKALQIIGPQLADSDVALAIHDTGHNAVSTANIGDTVHAAVTVSGSAGVPTGKVDILFYENSSCSPGGTPDPANPFLLSSGVVDPSTGQGPLAAGFYSFKAHYEGSMVYRPKDSACESFTIAKATPAVNTTIYTAINQPVTSVVSGTVVHDNAVVSGSAGTPTGTVDFTLYKNRTNCSGGPTQNYAGAALVNGVAKTPDFTTSHQSVSYKAHYNGDANYAAADGACEPLTVN